MTLRTVALGPTSDSHTGIMFIQETWDNVSRPVKLE